MPDALEIELNDEFNVVLDEGMAGKIEPVCTDPLPGVPLKLIVANEFAERFCFYGTRSLLVIYLTVQLNFSKADAISAYSLYMAGCYLSPLLGGYLADVYFGRFRTIVAFNVAYLLGVATWGTTAFVKSWPGCAVGLALMALGTGGIKPNISPLGADQLAGASERVLMAYFFWFYFAINFGSTLSYICTPLLRVSAGFPPAILLGLAMLVFSLMLLIIGRPWYRLIPPAGVSVYNTVARVIAAANPCQGDRHGGSSTTGEDASLLRSPGHASSPSDDPVAAPPARATPPAATKLVAQGTEASIFSWLLRARATMPETDVEGTIRLFRILPLFACLPFFWMLFDSQDSVWTLQREEMNLCAGSLCLAVEQLGAVNPILVMGLVPLFNMVIFPALYSLPSWLSWLRPNPLRQMAVGMQLAALAFVVSAIVEAKINAAPAHTVSFLWQLPQIFIITTAEILVSATGLEFAYSQAPASFKGSILALYYVSIAAGDLMSAVIYSSLSFLSSIYLLFLYAGLMSVSGVLFIVAAYFYVPAPHHGGEGHGGAVSEAAHGGDGDVRKRRPAADAPTPTEPLVVEWDSGTGKVKR